MRTVKRHCVYNLKRFPNPTSVLPSTMLSFRAVTCARAAAAVPMRAVATTVRAEKKLRSNSDLILPAAMHALLPALPCARVNALLPTTTISQSLSQETRLVLLLHPRAVVFADVSPKSVCAFVPTEPLLKGDHLKDDEKDGANKPSRDLLDRVSHRLADDALDFFVRSLDHDLLREDVILENRIRGTVTVGLKAYSQQMNVLKLLGHLRYTYIAVTVQRLHVDYDDCVVSVTWKICGLSILKLALYYVPKQLWKSENVQKLADTWMEGISSFYVDSAGKVAKHVVDNKREDKDKEAVSAVDKIRESLEKLKSPAVSPSL